MGKENEVIVGITRPYSTGNPDSLVLVVLKEARKLLNVKKGEPLHVKVDSVHGRLIYEPVKMRSGQKMIFEKEEAEP